MDDRIVQFIHGLRAAGVRVSLAESQDAMLATQSVSVIHRETFRAALKSTLVKERGDGPIFDALFPLYFQGGSPPLNPASEALRPEEMSLLRDALRALAGQLQELLLRMLEGQGPSTEELAEAAQRAGMNRPHRPGDQRWLSQRTLHQLGLKEIQEQIETLLRTLAELGMSPDALGRLLALLQANVEALQEGVSNYIGADMAERLSRIQPRQRADDLMDKPFRAMREPEVELLRKEVARLAARLRTRAALRQKRGKGTNMDAKATLRTNIRYGGVPFEIVHKEHKRKAKFTLICDVSTSMRPVVDFLLRLMHYVQDQVGRTRSFAFIDHIEEISDAFAEHSPELAVPIVLRRMPPGHYNTDMGFSLSQFAQRFLDSTDHRTTLIICGDGRNNFNNPRLDLVQMIVRRARKVVWFNPESPYLWGTDDSDMLEYARIVDTVYQVSTLRQLSEAIDRLFL